MKVLKVMPGMSPDAGAERSLMALVPEFRARGVQLHLAVLTERQSLIPSLESMGVVVHDLSGRRGLVDRVRALRSIIGSIKPDLVHATLFEATAPSQLAVVGTEVPLLISWANTNYGTHRLSEPGVSVWRVRAYQALEAVLGRVSGAWYHAVTPAVALVNARALLVSPERVFVGERGRDAGRLLPGPAGESICDEFGFPEDSRLVLAIGRQEPQKGYEVLLEAFDTVARHDPRAILLIAGRTGSSTEVLIAQHRAMTARSRVQFLDHRDDVPRLLHCVDAVVCSSWREGAAGALIEAMAAGAPVVSVPVGGLEGILIDGVNARVVPRDQLARGISEVLDDADLAKRLAEGGRRTFEERFTLDAAADRMVDIYRRVIAESAPDGSEEPLRGPLPTGR